ncbi:30S ribosomal protein S13, partial [candidate division WWE3 bacterium RIFOXYC2_FULL_40_11]
MPRIKGVDIPNDKRIEIALTYIYGVGKAWSTKILSTNGINPDTRAKDLTEEDIAKINKSITEFQILTEGELRRQKSSNIRRLQEIKSYRGLRHSKGLPTRGQRTRSNSRTRKGKRKTVGG